MVEKTPDVGRTEKAQDPNRYQSNEDRQEHTHSSPTPKSQSKSLGIPSSTSFSDTSGVFVSNYKITFSEMRYWKCNNPTFVFSF